MRQSVTFLVCPRVCVVRPLPREEVLSPPVLSVCLDSRGSALCGDSVLSHHTEHVPGHYTTVPHRTTTHYNIYFQGLIWFIMPIMMVIINDIMAYMFGFFMGRTPLIKLSPKKTWEGFIGGGIATVFMSLGLAFIMCQVCLRQSSLQTSP